METPAPEETPTPEEIPTPEETPSAQLTPSPAQLPEAEQPAQITPEIAETAKAEEVTEKTDAVVTGKTDETTSAEVKPDGSDITVDKPDGSGQFGMFRFSSTSVKQDGDKTIVTLVSLKNHYDAIYLGSVEDAQNDPENVCVGVPTGEGYTFEFAVPASENDQTFQIVSGAVLPGSGALDLVEGVGVDAVGNGGLQVGLDGESHVLRGDGLTVGPLAAADEVDLVHQTIVGHLEVGICQIGLQGGQVSLCQEQAAEHLHGSQVLVLP